MITKNQFFSIKTNVPKDPAHRIMKRPQFKEERKEQSRVPTDVS